jgi:GDP-mannose transporter
MKIILSVSESFHLFVILLGFIAGLVYSYAKAFPPKKNTSQSIPMSSSSQSVTDATKANSD